MAKNAVVDFMPTWFELTAPWVTFGSILKWCDTAHFAMFPVSPDEKQLFETFSQQSVMRSNTAEIFLSHKEINKLEKVRVKPVLQDVGQTSWVCGFRICDASPRETLIAAVETVMVHTDETHSMSRPIPKAEAVRRLIAKNNVCPLCLAKPEFSNSSNVHGNQVFKFSTMARLTDCDSLGHINNAVYATLAEEFRYYTASQGGYGNPISSEVASIATQPAVTCSISYIGQAQPFDTLDVTTWANHTRTGCDYNFEISVSGQLITQMKLGVESNKFNARL